MFQDFWFHVEYGIRHVLDINGYDHVLFLTLLALPYSFKQWKSVFWLVTTFTIGHTLSLVLAAYGHVSINGALVEFLIPITILLAAIYNVIWAGKHKSKINWVLLLCTLFFGVIHGLGFAREFKMLAGQAEDKLQLLIAFALGIEVAQIIIVLVVLLLGWVFQNILGRKKRDWIMVASAIIIGLVLPLIANSDFLA